MFSIVPAGYNLHHRTGDGKLARASNIMDGYGRECLAHWEKLKLNYIDVRDVLIGPLISRGGAIPNRSATHLRGRLSP
jgi:hypothetical protein